MRIVFRVLIGASILVSLAAISGFVLYLISYSLSEAFNPLFPHPEDLAAKNEMLLWAMYAIVGSATTMWLACTYRRIFRAPTARRR